MIVWFENIQCWEPGGGFRVSLDKSPPFDLTELAPSGVPAEIQVGPYSILIEVNNEVDPDTGVVSMGLVVAKKKVKVNFKHGHGKITVYSAELDLLPMQSDQHAIGKAHGLFDILW